MIYQKEKKRLFKIKIRRRVVLRGFHCTGETTQARERKRQGEVPIHQRVQIDVHAYSGTWASGREGSGKHGVCKMTTLTT